MTHTNVEPAPNTLKKGIEGRTFTPEEIVYITNYVSTFKEGTHYRKDGDCHTWTRSVTTKGYGAINLSMPKGRATLVSHRAVWIATNGTNLSPEDTIDHLCRNKRCINIQHMDVCSRADNNRNSNSIIMELMARDSCNKGHPLAENNLNSRVSTRQCRACNYARSAVWKAAKHGSHFSDSAFNALADAYYRYFTQGGAAPLFVTSPEAWEGIYFQPRITRIAEENVTRVA